MKAILDIIVPVFGTVAVGWVLGRLKLLTPEGLRGLTNTTFYALFPCLLFRSMAKVHIEKLAPNVLVLFFGSALLLYFLAMIAGKWMGMKLGERAVFSLSATFSNTSGIGIPFISYAYGDAGLVPVLMIVSVNALILLTLSSFFMEVGTHGSGQGRLIAKFGGALWTMLKHPVIPPIFAGLVWSELTVLIPGLEMPVVIDRVVLGLATAAPPCALILAGASLAHVGLRDHWQPAVMASVVKLVLAPLVVWVAGTYLFTLDPMWLAVATLNAALPTGSNAYLVAYLYKTGAGLATNTVVISTAASLFTLTAALLLLGVQPP